jgi:hypothetical protein
MISELGYGWYQLIFLTFFYYSAEYLRLLKESWLFKFHKKFLSD